MWLVLAAVLAQCPPATTAVLPPETVGVSLEEARRAERELRDAAETALGACVHPDDSEQRAAEDQCRDDACLATGLGVRWLMRAQLIRAGGVLLASGSLFDLQSGKRLEVQGPTGEREPAWAALAQALLLEGPDRAVRQGPPRWVRWAALALVGAAIVGGGVALGTGLQARATEQRLSSGDGGCGTTGAAYRGCLEQQLSQGRTLATASTGAAFGSGVALALGAAGLVWSW
ncbi:MAG: hypothetical protein K1X89_24945 [Myxococcaceae bacterium]|nr:hypothetical protein [Myxococcaceae bacterium]